MKTNRIAVIGVPSSAGARQTGQERAPFAFREAGIIDALRSTGFEVLDFGNLSPVAYRPDPGHPHAQNVELVRNVVSEVSEAFYRAASEDAVPFILGGDCTITLGAVSGLLRCDGNAGLIYFDGDVDFNDPSTTTSGIFDGMVMAHLMGRGAPELTRLGPTFPLLREDQICLFGYNNTAGWIDAPEMQLLQNSKLRKYPLEEIRNDVHFFAREATAMMEKRAERILVHFDVDVIEANDFPVADVLHSGGLPYRDAMDALRIFLSSQKVGGLVVTEFNANRDPNGQYARKLVHDLSACLPLEKLKSKIQT